MLTQKKMFVHYSGTLAQFKESNYPTEYSNSIVFIGNGEAIYAKGKYYGDVKDAITALQQSVDGLSYFRGIKAGEVTAWAADKNGVITFTSGDNSVVTVNADTKGVHINLKESFVNDVTTTKQGLADEITRATNAENKIKADLGTKDETKGTAFERIAAIEGELDALSGGVGSIQTQIDNAISALDLPNTYEAKGEAAAALAQAKTYAEGEADDAQAAAEATAEGLVNAAKTALTTEINKKANSADVDTKVGELNAAITKAQGDAEKYAKDYADGLASNYDAAGAAASAESAAKAYADGLASNYDAAGSAATAKSEAIAAANQYTDGKVSEINGVNEALAGRVKANEDAIVVLNGEGDGSVKKQVAEAIAGVVNSAPEDFDTLKEVADWIASDTTGAAKMQSDIAKLNGADTVEGSVAYQVKVEADRAKLAEQGLSTSISNLDAAYKAADTELSGKITALEGVQGDYATKTELANEKSALETAITDAVAAEKKLREEADALKANVADVNATVEGINAEIAKKATTTALNEAVEDLQGAIDGEASTRGSEITRVEGLVSAEAKTRGEEDTRILGEAKAHTNTEVGKVNTRIDNLDYTSGEGFVTKITQTDGLVSATVATSIAAEKITIADSADHFPAEVANVEQALAFMANMLTWEEL